VTSLDLSPTALKQLLTKFQSLGLEPPTAVLGKLEEMPLASDQFDLVLAADVLPPVKNVRRALEEIQRILKPAGHCVVNEETGATEPAEGFRVVTGAVNWTVEEGRQVSHVVRAIPYPKFVPGTARDGYGDAALLVLETPTTVPSIPIATPANRGLMKVGRGALIAGWGMTRYGEETFDESLMWAHTVVESDRCEGLWGRICAIDFPAGRSGVCHGDSGGPLLAHRKHGKGYVEIAIVEAGFGKCTTRRPQIFTRTDLIAAWIGKTMAKNEGG